LLSDKGFKPKFTLEKGKVAFGLKELLPYARVTRVTRMAYSPSLWLMAIGW
jgi:hypothetical protein